ncbi:MAG TPA: mechanosensitive ion channel domain-containing protein [Microvirga sp.]|jgi:small-conductance mechanosensitive channel|nr:mechanosensitive ion channel domain-containing protein [Microvirga sp.]
MLSETGSLLRAVQAADAALPEWLGTILFLGLTAFLAMFAHAALLRILQFVLRGRLREVGRGMLARTAAPTRFGLVVVAVAAALPFTGLQGQARALVEWMLLLGFIGFLGWTAVAAINVGAQIYIRHVPQGSEDKLLARKHLTQVQLLRRIAVFAVLFLTFSVMLMTVPAVREYGMSLFASAGVAGLVIGLAARPVLSNLIAGVQLAVTQPIRIGDEVTVENEFGTVEEIRTSYVVLRLWDLRRMVVPLTYFMEKPFQNWTRESTSIIGRVLWYVDYTVPIDSMREAFLVTVRASPLWDGQTAALQITDVTQEAVQVRGIMSAASSSAAFDLSCEIREKMILWLQGNNPMVLPQVRTNAVNGAANAAGAEAAAHH